MSKRRKGIPWQTPNFYVPGYRVAKWHAWIAMCIRLKQSYSGRLMDLIEKDLAQHNEGETE